MASEVLRPKPPHSSWAREAFGLNLRCLLFCRCKIVQDRRGENLHPQIGAFIERRSLRSKKTLAHTENSMSNNSNIQGVGPRRSTRLNVTLGEMAPPPRGSTMGTTAVTTRGEVHDTTTAVQASHSRPPRVEQLAPAA